MPITAEAQAHIKNHLDKVTKDTSAGTSGLAFCAIDKNGDYLNQTYSGVTSSNPDLAVPISSDSVFWIASCTKLITAIACMQLHEQGIVDIESADSLYKLCPELKSKHVLTDKGQLEPMQGEITLRKLLDHTAGFGYTFFNPKLRDYSRPTGFDEFSGDIEDFTEMPLVNQPGSRWEYGINIDWAGIAVMRATKTTLDEYFKKNIFEPLGVEDVSFIPNRRMREHLVTVVKPKPEGGIIDIDHPARRAIWHADNEQRRGQVFQSGGAGCFAKPAEYCKILAALVNNGTSAKTGKQILKPETVDTMFTNSVPQFPDFARQSIPAAKPELTNPIPELYPQEGNPPQGWGLTFHMNIEPCATGRAANGAYWAGIVNLFYWLDRTKGVAGMIAGQKLPFGDPGIMGAWVQCETAVYQGLQ